MRGSTTSVPAGHPPGCLSGQTRFKPQVGTDVEWQGPGRYEAEVADRAQLCEEVGLKLAGSSHGGRE